VYSALIRWNFILEKCVTVLCCSRVISTLQAVTDTNVNDNAACLNDGRIVNGQLLESRLTGQELQLRVHTYEHNEMIKRSPMETNGPTVATVSLHQEPKYFRPVKTTDYMQRSPSHKAVEEIFMGNVAVNNHDFDAQDRQGAASDVFNTAVSLQKVEHSSVDPQLHLLDFQLRNILKPSPAAARDDSLPPGDIPKFKVRTSPDASPGRSFMHSFSTTSLPAFNRDQHQANITVDSMQVRSARRSACDGEFISYPEFVNLRLDASENRNPDVEEEMLVIEMSKSRLSRVDQSKRASCIRLESKCDDDGLSDEKRESKNQVFCPGSAITFGIVEEISHANVQAEDLPTTNAYLDDHATRAAPFTLASQFITLGSDDEDDNESNDDQDDGDVACKLTEHNDCCDERVSNGQTDLANGVSLSQAAGSKTSKRPLALMRQIQDTGERISEKINARDFVWRRSSLVENRSNMSEKADVLSTQVGSSRPPFSIAPLTPDAIPRPKFSVRSPSSPGRFCFTDMDSVNNQLASIDTRYNMVFEPVTNDIYFKLPASGHESTDVEVVPAPLAVQEDDNSNASCSDGGCRAMLCGTAVSPKSALFKLNTEDRGIADGESPRLSGDLEQGSGDAVQCSGELSEKLSSYCTDMSALGVSKSALPDSLCFGATMGASKLVPMAIAKRIADCLDLSNGSDVEIKDILSNGFLPSGVPEKIDRTVSSVPLSRFAAVNAIKHEDCNKLSSIDGKADCNKEHVKMVQVAKFSSHYSSSSTAFTSIITNSVVQVVGSESGQFDGILSESVCDQLAGRETFSSPEHSCLPRPPSARVSKKALIATRAR